MANPTSWTSFRISIPSLLTVLLLAGCSTSQTRENGLSAHGNDGLRNGSRAPSAAEVPSCPTSCASGQACMNVGEGQSAACAEIPASPGDLQLTLPFDSKSEVVCTHSSGVGSHSYANAFYALDLATPYELPPSTVRAAADGVAFVFLSEDGKPCETPPGSDAQAAGSDCGDSWGNRVKVLHAGGYYSFYVHLAKVLVKSGTHVRKGDALGIEGRTGQAGHRHLHWSVQKLPGTSEQEWLSRIWWTGSSVPFRFTADQNGELKTFDTATVSCPHVGIDANLGVQQPHFRGVTK